MASPNWSVGLIALQSDTGHAPKHVRARSGGPYWHAAGRVSSDKIAYVILRTLTAIVLHHPAKAQAGFHWRLPPPRSSFARRLPPLLKHEGS